MKKERNIEEIMYYMQCNEQDMQDECDIISDEMVQKKLEAVVDIEQVDREGMTLLMSAVLYNRVEALRYLLLRGANVNKKDKNGCTALHLGVQQENLEVIKVLLENGANINEKDIFGNSPIMYSSPDTSKEMFEMLMAYGANPKQQNKYSISAVDMFSAYPEILRVLDTDE